MDGALYNTVEKKPLFNFFFSVNWTNQLCQHRFECDNVYQSSRKCVFSGFINRLAEYTGFSGLAVQGKLGIKD